MYSNAVLHFSECISIYQRYFYPIELSTSSVDIDRLSGRLIIVDDIQVFFRLSLSVVFICLIAVKISQPQHYLIGS